MNVPSLSKFQFVDSQGNLTDNAANLLSVLLGQLQSNFGTEGIVVPNQPATGIALLTNSANGTMVYDATNHLAKINLNGTFETITTS